MERSNEWVEILTARGGTRIPWGSRQLLLEQLRKVSGTEAIVDVFEAVGTSRPVRLDAEGKDLLLLVIRQWLSEVNVDGLPAGIFGLDEELVNDAHDRGVGP